MILADTSVVIDYAKGRDAKLAAVLRTLAVSACGITRAEIMCGARGLADRLDLRLSSSN
jgi:predicted nucleic acid-binding protein